MEKWELGFNKKSFSLNYSGGEIWCEHLDSMQNKMDLLKSKLADDLKIFKRPSVSSYIIVVLDETDLKGKDVEYIFNEINNSGKMIRKMAFTGLDRRLASIITKISKNVSYPVKCIDDLEKAKEWVI